MYLFLVLIVVFFTILIVGSNSLSKDAIKMVKERKNNDKEDLEMIEKAIRCADGYGFEYICAKIFRLNGYLVEQTPKSNDGGKDLIIKKNGETIYVECKHYSDENLVSRPIINKLIGVAVNDGIKKAIIITTSGYARTSIELIENCTCVDIDKMYLGDLLDMCKGHTREIITWLYA